MIDFNVDKVDFGNVSNEVVVGGFGFGLLLEFVSSF